ncbi:hypothetical protein NFI96_008752 [Prochilodus magdalenae]|nr:hypothetical protein NFI96_008752 [Prochilodus magdalenae]
MKKWEFTGTVVVMFEVVEKTKDTSERTAAGIARLEKQIPKFHSKLRLWSGGTSPAGSRAYKVAAGCLGLMCVLLLAVITVLWLGFTAQIDLLQTSYTNLTIERDQLQTSYTNLTKLKYYLETSYISVVNERDELQKRCSCFYTILTALHTTPLSVFFKTLHSPPHSTHQHTPHTSTLHTPTHSTHQQVYKWTQVDSRMGHVFSRPVNEDNRTRGKKRLLGMLSPEALSAKRRKIMDLASGNKLEGVTVRPITTQPLEKPQPGTGPSSASPQPTVSSTATDAHADVLSEQALITHEMVLKDVSTDELLRLLGDFLCRRCCLLKDLSPDDPLMWLRIVDMFLLLNGCQAHFFIGPGSVVFLYMLCRDTVSAEVSSMKELQVVVLTCFFVAYAYIGHEIGYPAMPFLVEENRGAFWKRTVDITKRMSGKMLRINNDPQFFKDIFTDLKNAADR